MERTASPRIFFFPPKGDCMTDTLDIIIVNWNAGKPLRDCLLSIKNAEKSGFNLTRVVVVDNGSTDGSLDVIHPGVLLLIVTRKQKKGGFAAPCNKGKKKSKADSLFFLTPDPRLFRDTLSKPIQFMQQPENAH